MTIQRRNFLSGGTALFGLLTLGFAMKGIGAAQATEGVFAVTMTDQEWRAKLGDFPFEVLRKEATERAFTSPLLDEHRSGTFVCAGCDLELFASETKYDSGTGWPSFYDFIPGGIGTKVDNSLFGERTEVHCTRCGGHQGHVFNDGPQPTGLRYCINGVSIRFVAA